MNPPNIPETDRHILSELKELLVFAPPGKLRRSLLDLYFHCMTTSETPDLPNHEELNLHFYYLINFLNEVESINNACPPKL